MVRHTYIGLTAVAAMAAMLAAGCEKEIKVDVDAQDARVVVQGENIVGQPLAFNLTYSRPTFSTFYVRDGEDYFPRITDATLTLSVDGGAAMTASRDGGTYTFAHTPQPGEVLSLGIAVPGRQPLSSTATVPYEPVVSDIDTSTSVRATDYYTAIYFNISFTLNDRATSDDYYSVRILRVDSTFHTVRDTAGNITAQDTSTSSNYRYFNCTDYLLVSNAEIDLEDPTATSTFSGYEMLFTDASINGTNHTIRLETEEWNDYYIDEYKADRSGTDSFAIRTTYYLVTTAYSRDHYLYRQTRNSYSNDELLSLISEPVQIHSNIEGGIGIFGVSARRIDRVCTTVSTEVYNGSWETPAEEQPNSTDR